MNPKPSTPAVEPLAVVEWKSNYSMPQSEYSSSQRYEEDLKLLGEQSWLMVDHASRIPNTGDYFVFEFGSESIIVVRDKSGTVKAHYNVCRHRGSRICLDKSGTVKTLSCPYHAWTYDLDGQLRVAPHCDASLDKSQLGLVPCNVQVFEGIVFINLAQPGQAPDFESFIGRFRPFLAPHQLSGAKVAARHTYPTKANWKLSVENFLECYHCRRAHPTYCSVHDELKLLAFGAGAGSGDTYAQQYAPTLEAWEREEAAQGRSVGMFSDDEQSTHFQSAGRLPIGRGNVTESIGGQPVAPVMVSYGKFDGAQTGCVFSPISYVLACSDHAVMLRLTPRGPLSTDAEMIWLVRADATEGVDYDVTKLMALWDTTLKEDKTITENNQEGVMSRAYVPGPFQPQEQRIADFGRWYMKRRAAHA